MSRPYWLLSIAVVAVLLLPAALCDADFSQAVKQIDPAVVTISSGEKSGAGFIFSPDGYVLTNRHVVEESADAEIKVKLQNDESLPATVAHSSVERDLGVLKIERTNLPVVQFASSDKLTTGQDVAAIGAPLGLEHSVTRGVISALSREIEGKTYTQIDAALNEGNSGGPVINENGQVIGVAVRVASEAQNVGFAVPSVAVMQFLQANGLNFNVVLGDAPAAAETEAEAEDASPTAEEGPAPVPAQPPEGTPAPAPAQVPASWLLWPTIISFVVSLLTALVVSLIFARRGPSSAVQAGAGPAATVGTGAIMPPPAAPAEEDLSDIEIDLH